LRIKSAYKTPAPDNIPEEPPQPSETVRVEFIDKTNPDKGTVAAIDTAIPDEAGEALRQQLNALRQSEELQKQFALHQRAAQMAQRTQPMSREQKLEVWKSQGLSDSEADWLRERPALIDRPEITQQAVAAASRAGLERGSDDFHAAVENNFNTLMGRAEAQAAPATTPEFFSPPPARSPEPPGPASYVSAPVSRRAAGSTMEPSPRSVKLSVLEQEIARNLGLSDVDYAQGKLRMMRAKANGEISQ
jgi:hypothetical protein